MSVLSNAVEDTLVMHIDDFFLLGDNFEDYLVNLSHALQRCEELNLVINWEYCHIIVKKGLRRSLKKELR